MRHFIFYSVGLMILLICGVFYAKGETDANAKKSLGQRVKESIEGKYQVHAPTKKTVRNCSALNWREPFRERHYQLTYSSDVEFLKGSQQQFGARSMEWNVEKGSHSEQIRLTVVDGSDYSDARDKLYEIMGARTNRMITPFTYEVLKDGPGDVCIIMPERWTTEYKPGKIRHAIWFIRDNIGVELACSGNIDLLPIAKALDQAIRSCSEETKDKATE